MSSIHRDENYNAISFSSIKKIIHTLCGLQLQFYNYNYKVSLFSKLFSEESCSVVGLSEQMSFQLGSELLATDVQ